MAVVMLRAGHIERAFWACPISARRSGAGPVAGLCRDAAAIRGGSIGSFQMIFRRCWPKCTRHRTRPLDAYHALAACDAMATGEGGRGDPQDLCRVGAARRRDDRQGHRYGGANSRWVGVVWGNRGQPALSQRADCLVGWRHHRGAQADHRQNCSANAGCRWPEFNGLPPRGAGGRSSPGRARFRAPAQRRCCHRRPPAHRPDAAHGRYARQRRSGRPSG